MGQLPNVADLGKKRRALRAALGAWLAAAAFAAQAQWTFDLGAERMHDDNLSRAQSAADIVGDSAARFSLSAARLLLSDGLSTVALSGDARAVAYDSIHGLSHVALGGTLSWRRKLGLGLTVPWLEGSLSASREAYRESIRDGNRFEAMLAGGWRFSETFQAVAGGRYDRYDSRNNAPLVPGIPGTPFDLQGRSLFARAALDASERLQLSLGFALRSGDVVSSSRRNFAIFRASNAISADPAFGADYFAYRLSGATTRSVSLGASWAIDNRSSINASLAAERTRADQGLNYSGNLVGISYLYRH